MSNDTRLTGLNNNDLIIGATGSGKTGGYVIPNLQRTDHSMIISDTKRNLYRMFKGDLERRGFKVHVLDFVDPENSCGYNPIDHIRMNPDGTYKEQDIAIISNCLVPVMDINEPFWEMAVAIFWEMVPVLPAIFPASMEVAPYSPSARAKVRMVPEAMPGPAVGTTTRQKISGSLIPRVRPA